MDGKVDLNELHPMLREKAKKFVEDGNKLLAGKATVFITQTARSEAYQNSLYAKGRTAPGPKVTDAKYPMSPHCWGLAFDFAIKTPDGKVAWDLDEDNDRDGQKDWWELGHLAVQLGLEWGGNWTKFKDYPHCQMMLGYTMKSLVEKWKTPEAFIASWSSINPPKMASVTATVLNVRKGAGTNFPVIFQVNKGQKVEILPPEDQWTKIKVNGKIGFVNDKYLKHF